MKKAKPLEVALMAVLSLAAAYLLNRFWAVLEGLPAGNPIERLLDAVDAIIPSIGAAPLSIGVSKASLLAGACGFGMVWLMYLYRLAAPKRMYGIEHGSAEWGSRRDSAPLRSKDPDQNIVLPATEQISMGQAKNYEHDRNKNVIVVGGSGSGKTVLVKENLMQLHSSYVITDPKGTLLPQTGYLFTKNGWKVRNFNTINFKKSLHYNPLAYIHSEKDILKVVNVLIKNTNGDASPQKDPFWEQGERLLYTALIAYLMKEARPSERNIPSLIDLLEHCQVREDIPNYKSPVDILMDDLAQREPDCLAVRQYRKFKVGAGKTMASILISCAARLAPFDIEELRELMSYDELELDSIGDHRTALFITMSDTDTTFSFLIAMLMYQLFNLLTEKADDEYHGRLPIHVRCILDEFANIGKIPDFHVLISTIRSREISTTIMLQSLAQLNAVYKDHADTIQDCCDSMVFLGGKSTKTTKQIAEMMGKTTITGRDASESKGQSGSYSVQDRGLGRDLLDPAEVGRIGRTECLVIIVGLPPFRSRKVNNKRHKRYRYISDSGKVPLFDITQATTLSDQHFFDTVSSVEEVELDLSELNSL